MYSESNNLSVVNELLAICDLPLRERDFIEAEKAILGKTATVLYTIIVACCVAIIGAYGMSAQLPPPVTFTDQCRHRPATGSAGC